MLYAVEVDFQAYELNTYVNDQNIIDKPLIREENGMSTVSSSPELLGSCRCIRSFVDVTRSTTGQQHSHPPHQVQTHLYGYLVHNGRT